MHGLHCNTIHNSFKRALFNKVNEHTIVQFISYLLRNRYYLMVLATHQIRSSELTHHLLLFLQI